MRTLNCSWGKVRDSVRHKEKFNKNYIRWQTCVKGNTALFRAFFCHHLLLKITETSSHSGQAEVIPWQWFAKQQEQMCCGTVVSQDYVLARSSCINNSKVQVHAGAFNANSANQTVNASLLVTSKPPPEGVVALQLDPPLSFNEHVSAQRLRDEIESRLGSQAAAAFFSFSHSWFTCGLTCDMKFSRFPKLVLSVINLMWERES